MGIHALNEGFAIRAEGEELILKTDNDVALAEELGLMTASPRFAPKIAASHNVEDTAPLPEAQTPQSNLAAIAFALGGVLILAGGVLLRSIPSVGGEAGLLGPYWLAFSIGGTVMVAVAYLLGLRVRWAQVLAVVALAGLIVVFILAIQDAPPDASETMAYGFIAGGIVVGVSVLFSGVLTGDR